MMYPVEIVKLDPYEVLARGEISDIDAGKLGILICPDEVVRLSDLLWDVMLPEAKAAFLMKFNAKEVCP